MTAQGKHWWERDTAPGFILLAATILSFLLLSGPFGEAFHHLLEDQIGDLWIGVGAGAHPVTLHLAINDGLMVIFFLYVGLELKRETVEGPFKNPREAALPMAGALGGMAAPALIYVAINWQSPEFLRGWAIPAATDIAFALGVMSLLGPRVPEAEAQGILEDLDPGERRPLQAASRRTRQNAPNLNRDARGLGHCGKVRRREPN